jgi:hypothetical protein
MKFQCCLKNMRLQVPLLRELRKYETTNPSFLRHFSISTHLCLRIANVSFLSGYLLTPWSRVLLEKLSTWVILNIRFFYGEGLLAPCPTPKLEDHPSSAVRGCLFNLFTATLHIGGRSSIRNLRARHAVVTGTHIHGLPFWFPD